MGGAARRTVVAAWVIGAWAFGWHGPALSTSPIRADTTPSQLLGTDARGNGLLAFTSTRTGDQDIYTMFPNGSQQTDITNTPGVDAQPAWSPDGSRIAFATNRTGNYEIFVMDADGSNPVNVSKRSSADTQPTWSPDGTRIAFTSKQSGKTEIFVMTSTGNGRTNLTMNPASDSDPAWSPDGSRIAFSSDRSGSREVWVMNADGSSPAALTSDPASDAQPAWSPDGSLLAFTSTRDGNSEVYVMNADGSGPANMTNNPAADSDPAFSPDRGTSLAFASKRDGDFEVYSADALDGSDPADLSHDSSTDATPDWQPLVAGLPNGSPIEHVVFIDMENHTFDNVLGKLCVTTGTCDGATSGELLDGTVIPLAPATDIVPVVDHEPSSQRKAINHGEMNGWELITGCEAQTGYACYTQFDESQIPSLWSLAETFALSDQTFQQDSIATWGSHLELVAAGLNGFDGLSPYGQFGPGWGCDSGDDAGWHATPWEPHTPQPSCIPDVDGSGPYRPSPVQWIATIMDRLDDAGLTWKIYGGYPGEPGLGYHLSICPSFAECLYGPQRENLVLRDEFVLDAAAGTLPNLSIMTPSEPKSQHNNDSMIRGDDWIAEQVTAAMNGPDWQTTAIFITYDDCGCFYDHVPPPPGLGIRVPMVIVSPYAKPGFVDSNVASFPSMLAFVEHTFGLAPLSPEDASAYDYAESFDYSQRPLPPIDLPRRRLPLWEIRWLHAHPPDGKDWT
jgi:phospholipase C